MFEIDSFCRQVSRLAKRFWKNTEIIYKKKCKDLITTSFHVCFERLPNNVLLYRVRSSGKKLFFDFCFSLSSNFVGFVFFSKSGAKCVSCTYKASAGFLYPLERGFIYITKPPIYIHRDDVASCGFNRSNTATGRTFDFEILLKSGGSNVFSNIDKYDD